MVNWAVAAEGHPDSLDPCNTPRPEVPSDAQAVHSTYTPPMGLNDVTPLSDGSTVTSVTTIASNETVPSIHNDIPLKNVASRRDLSSDSDPLGSKSQSGPPSLSTAVINAPGTNPTITSSLALEENYEGFGYVEELSPSQRSSSCSSAPSPTNGQSSNTAKTFNNSPVSTLGRHTWLRTSLRRTPASGKRQLGSNALASQLYRSGSFNSSGRGSTCDATDDMYSDISLEDDVIDLNHRVRMIQEQMDALVDNQSSYSISSERYARVKEENATLQARVLMLEEASKDAEARNEEKLQGEQRRHKEWIARLEREKQLELENCKIKMQGLEVENHQLREQVTRLRQQLNVAKEERERLESTLEEANAACEGARQGERSAVLKENELRVMLDAAKEELRARATDRGRVEELLVEVAKLRANNKSLEESRDELQAAAALQVGRELLLLNPATLEKNSKSLAAEMLDGSKDSVDGEGKKRSLAEVLQALKEQQEVNAQLRAYIDGILLNIVENYPQLLEVKQPQ
ncbi:rab11 family-interacting protein 4 [Diachasmimorpha longicaudata]|uniref:rab11 family-interacting protein 4 n=1 Tax=Diachasmimorpha longicaudata TaxID=58733 RepID=UPI0030B8D80A